MPADWLFISYSAAEHVVNTRMFRSYGWTAARAVVDRCLGEY